MGYINFENVVTPLNDTILNQMQIELMKMVFPIGSTYITQENTNPNEILKFGTWERVKGKVLVGLDEDDEDFNEIGKTGGEKEHQLTIDEMPEHAHPADDTVGLTLQADATYQYSGSGIESTSGFGKPWGKQITPQGGNQPHNNLQPYEIIGYVWIRRS